MEKKSIQFIFILVLMMSYHSFGQSETESEVLEGVGPGREHYFMQTFGFGFYAPFIEKNNPIKVWGSNEFWTGLKYRRKFNRVIAVGGEFNLQVGTYKIDQDAPNKVFKDTSTWTRERLTNISFELAPYIRFYFAHKQKSEGVYMDLGVNPEIMIGRFHTIVDRAATNGSKRTTNRRLKYMNIYRVSAQARVGWKFAQIYCKYRFTDLFRRFDGNLYPELARFSLGIIADLSVLSRN